MASGSEEKGMVDRVNKEELDARATLSMRESSLYLYTVSSTFAWGNRTLSHGIARGRSSGDIRKQG